jgi:hypothetical protein
MNTRLLISPHCDDGSTPIDPICAVGCNSGHALALALIIFSNRVGTQSPEDFGLTIADAYRHMIENGLTTYTHRDTHAGDLFTLSLSTFPNTPENPSAGRTLTFTYWDSTDTDKEVTFTVFADCLSHLLIALIQRLEADFGRPITDELIGTICEAVHTMVLEESDSYEHVDMNFEDRFRLKLGISAGGTSNEVKN